MHYIRFVLPLLLLVVAAANKPRFEIEIMSKGSDSIIARFRPFRRVKKYFVSVTIKYMADISSDFVADIYKSDIAPDGYYYFNTENSLQPGQLYEIVVYNSRKFSRVGSKDVFTDCDPYSYQCYSIYNREICLSAESLCDGRNECVDGSDERRFAYNESCAIVLPERPTPPPPPKDAPCIRALQLAERRGDSELPECDGVGNYAVMKCGGESSFSCDCLHPLTGKTLYSQLDFNPFVHYDFRDNCVERRNEAITNSKKP